MIEHKKLSQDTKFVRYIDLNISSNEIGEVSMSIGEFTNIDKTAQCIDITKFEANDNKQQDKNTQCKRKTVFKNNWRNRLID